MPGSLGFVKCLGGFWFGVFLPIVADISFSVDSASILARDQSAKKVESK